MKTNSEIKEEGSYPATYAVGELNLNGRCAFYYYDGWHCRFNYSDDEYIIEIACSKHTDSVQSNIDFLSRNNIIIDTDLIPTILSDNKFNAE